MHYAYLINIQCKCVSTSPTPEKVTYHFSVSISQVEEALSDYSRALQLKPHDAQTRTEYERLRDVVAQRAAACAAMPE